MNLALAVFLPFAAGFFLSFLFRIVNGVIAKDLAGTFSLAPDQLGLLSSTYLLAFAAMQVPVGVLLDRYGPRRVVAALLLVAGAGSLAFALANGFATLALGRALIGVGVAACLTGAMKAFTLWYPMERLSSLNGLIIAVGGLGGVAATAPFEIGTAAFGWRAMFMLLAALCVASAASIFSVVPEKRVAGAAEGWATAFRRVGEIFGATVFWRVGLALMVIHASFQALLGLWLAPWLIDVAGLTRAEAANWLFAAVLAYTAGSLFFGVGADQLSARGFSRLSVLKWGTGVAVLALFGLAAAPAQGKFALLLVYTFSVIAPALAYALLTRHFPPDVAGRVNTALNVGMFVSAFIVQWGVGAVLHAFPADGARYSPEGYALALGTLATLHVAVWLWLATLKQEPMPHRQ